MTPLLLALLVGGLAPAADECPTASRFTFQVERPRGGSVQGLQVRVEAGGPRGVRLATDVVSDSGGLLVCLPDGVSGEMVEVRLSHDAFRLLYPPRGRLPLSREGSPSLVVCQIREDCALLSTEEVARLIRAAQPQAQGMTEAQKAAFFREWLDYAKQLGVENGELFATLVRKERQIEASTQASQLLSRFADRARELLVRFDRHALEAMDHPSNAPYGQINEARAAYNPVFDEMKDQRASYLQKTADYWPRDVSDRFSRLFEEALAFHYAEVFPLNEALHTVNDCHFKRPTCPDRAKGRASVTAATEHVRAVALPRLDAFEKDLRAWLDDVGRRLFDEKGDKP